MRTYFAYGKQLIRSRTEVNDQSATPIVSLVYVAPDQAPTHFNPPSYSIGGWGYEAIPGFCKQAEDPNFPGRCADEAEIVHNMMTYFQGVYPDCTFSNIRVEGSYGEPFVYSRDYYGAGYLDFMTPQDRWLKNDTWCPGWGQDYPDPWQFQLVKVQTYDCPVGFWPIWGYNPAYNNTGNPDYIAIWPYLCTAGKPEQRIVKRDVGGPSQTPSCPANENPCFPATADKMRNEPDLWFAGKPFSRYYHSLQEIQQGDAVGVGWGHTFLERVSGLTRPSITTEDGVYQFFIQTGYHIYRGAQNSEDLLVVLDDGSYLLTKANGEKRFYSTDGSLLSIVSEKGAAYDVALTYQRGQLVLATDGLGRTLSFSYANGVLKRVSQSDGGYVDYDYDSERNLVAANYADGSVRSYYYNEEESSPANIRHLLTGIADGAERYATFSYDSRGFVEGSALHAAGTKVAETRISYVDGESALVTTPLGESLSYALSNGAFKQVTGISGSAGTKVDGYDQNGRLTSSIDRRGVSASHSYSDAVASASDAVRVSTVAVQTLQERSTETARDDKNHVVEKKVSTSQGVVSLEKFAYNSAGLLSFYCEYAPGESSALSYQCGSQASAPVGVRQTSYAYCAESDVANTTDACPLVGLMKSIDGPSVTSSDVAFYSYYPSDDTTCATTPATCPQRKGDLWKFTNALGQVTEYLSYDGAGRMLSMKDANGTITDFTYHPRGWLTASKVRGTDDTGESDDRITLIDYWPTGLVKQVTQPDGAFTAFTYDTAHRLTDIADNAGNTLHYTLDNAGNRVKEDTKDASGTLKRTLSRVYNQLGQLATQATASGDPTDFGYDANGNTKTVTDALSHVTQNDYDPLNRLARTLQDVGGIAAETKFGYDALDNLTKVTDPKGLDTTYAYNGLGDMTKLTSPDTGVTTYTYDSAGNRATQTDARNIKTTYSYDALNRLTKVTYPTSSHNVTYTYDVSQTTCASGETYAIGRLSRMQDSSGTTDYCYDRFGDLVRKVQTTNGKVFVLRYAYTKAGQLSRLTYPDGAAVDYVRNAQGQTTEVGVTPAGGTRQVLLGNATYYPFGPVASWSYGNGRPMQRVLDQDYRPLAVSDTRSDGLSTGFAFDPAGNLSALTAAGNTAPVVSLDYDALGRLTAFKDGPTGTVIDGYSYDATGNRLSAKVNTSTQSYTYPTTKHRLSAVAGTARTYDAIGNTLSIGGTAQEFAYDATGRMSQAKRAGTVVMKYGYNGRGEQVRRVDKTNTYTLYDESGHWLGNYDANGASLQQAIWLDDLPVGVLAKNSLRYVQPDHLGTPRAVIDPVRDVAIWTWDLKGEAFGNTSPDQDPDKDGTAFVFDMRFPGQRYDAATGFNQNYFRDYDPSTGRYGQSDPIGLNGGLNTYGYSLQAPLDHSDAWGLATWKGNSYGVGGGAGRYGGFIDFYQLTSPCPDGGLAYVYIMALGGAGGIGYPISMTGSSVELSDADGVPDPNIFNGPYAKFSVGSVSFGPGYQLYQKITIGGAWTSLDTGAKGSGWHQSQGGFDGSLYSVGVGQAIVLEKKECNKCGGK
ncbi:RHS repeat-associated core domain-containing protein [Xanthomonas hyacinthi]|uniref:RHS repeat-associated core domain-containing protein n=1 Tax=Xanthomonas hyacinthi TaxID=56455 RepID=UPI001FCAF5DE|nr:RHS repeat-associated core domain-containing protein [Xanthomonas hyacinthi]